MQKSRINSIMIPALSVGVAMLMLGYSAYGWLSMIKQVRATGMVMKVTAPNSLEISLTGNDNDYYSNIDVSFKEVVERLIKFKGDEIQFQAEKDEFSLLPASSYEGLSVWQTSNATHATGAAACAENEYINEDGERGRIKYNAEYQSFEGYYIDVPIWIRSSSGIEADIIIKMSDEDGTVVSKISGDDRVVNVVRIAFLNEDATAISCKENDGFEDALVLTGQGAKAAKVVASGNDSFSKTVSPKYINTPVDNTKNIVICRMPSPGEQIYAVKKITVRIWVEGEDSACISSIKRSKFGIKLKLGIRE